jgi:hypothetical protein
MRNILIFAGIASIAAAIAIYFTSESNFNSESNYIDDTDDTATGYVTDADIEAFDMRENTGDPYPVP